MKSKLILFILFISIIYLFNACKRSTSTQPDPPNIVADSSYFPVEDDAFYKYDIVKRDSNGLQSFGIRSTLYNGTAIKEGITYQLQIDTINITGQDITTNLSYFRKTEAGLYYFLDTTGFAEAIGPDEIQNLIFDQEMRLLIFPIYDLSSWDIFLISYQNVFTPIKVTGAFAGIETLTLNLTSGPRNFETVKLKFTLIISIPGNPVMNYETYGWIAQGIGFVKWEGNATIVGAFTGSGIDFADTTSVITQNLIEYNRID